MFRMRFEVTAMEELVKGNTFNKESAEILWVKVDNDPAASSQSAGQPRSTRSQRMLRLKVDKDGNGFLGRSECQELYQFIKEARAHSCEMKLKEVRQMLMVMV